MISPQISGAAAEGCTSADEIFYRFPLTVFAPKAFFPPRRAGFFYAPRGPPCPRTQASRLGRQFGVTHRRGRDSNPLLASDLVRPHLYLMLPRPIARAYALYM